MIGGISFPHGYFLVREQTDQWVMTAVLYIAVPFALNTPEQEEVHLCICC